MVKVGAVTEEYWFGGGYDIFEDLMVCEAPLRDEGREVIYSIPPGKPGHS